MLRALGYIAAGVNWDRSAATVGMAHDVVAAGNARYFEACPL